MMGIGDDAKQLRSGGMSERDAVIKTIKGKRGQKPLKFREGGLHASTGTKSGAKISAAKHAEAKSGKLGPKAKKQEMFYENVLRH